MRKAQWLGLAVLLPALLAAPAWGPPVLRRAPWFGVERVEVSGARLLAPREVLAASGIQAGESIWSEPGRWEAALAVHPVIVDAEVTRKLFRTLTIHIEEERPVALVEDDMLRPVTAAGEILPVDPARTPVDLPLLRARAEASADRRIDDAAVRALLAEIGRLGQLDPELVSRISEVRRGESGALLLTLTRPAAELVLAPGAEPRSLRRLRAVLNDIERRTVPHGPGAASARVARIDLRFEDQVVVRYP